MQIVSTLFQRYHSQLLVILALILSFSIKGQNILEKKISLKIKNQSIETVLKEIEQKATVRFSYSAQMIPVDKIISVHIKNKPLSFVLDEVLRKNNIDYVFLESQIILKKLPVVKEGQQEAKKQDVPRAETKIKQTVKKKKFTLSGYVREEETGEVLLGVAVYAKGTIYGTITNEYGFYSITLEEGEYEVVYSYVGYESQRLALHLNKSIKHEVQMVISTLFVDAVVIKASDSSQLINEVKKVDLRMLERIPPILGEMDALKGIQSIPGISSLSDGASPFYVRGGNMDQNLILLDEVPLYNPAHLLGFVSSVTPDAIKDIRLYKGDFPARYGGRVAAVVDVRTKDGDMNAFSGNLALNPYVLSASLDGPIVKNKASYYISARKSKLNWLVNRVNENLNVDFYDINTKLNWVLNKNNRLFLTLFSGNDEIMRQSLARNRTSGMHWYNRMGTIRWNHLYSNKLFSNLTLYSTHYNYRLYLNKDQNNYWQSEVSNTALKLDYTYYPNTQHTLRWGAVLGTYQFDPGNVYLSNENIKKYVPQIMQYRSATMDLYVSNEQKIGKKLELTYGLRIPTWINRGEGDFYVLDEQFKVKDTLVLKGKERYASFIDIEPRVKCSYRLSSTQKIEFNYNRTVQYIQMISNSITPFTSLDVWIPSGPNMAPQRANHLSLNYLKSLKNNKVVAGISGFYSIYDNQVDYTDHANLLFNPLLEAELRQGKMSALGLELFAKKSLGALTGMLSYSYSSVYRKTEGVNGGKTYPALQDRPHQFSINLNYDTGNRWLYSCNWVYMSGNPYTAPVGFYRLNGSVLPLYNEKNNARLPDYHHLDVSIQYKVNKASRRIQQYVSLSLYNLYGRKNPFSINYNKILDDKERFVVPTDLDGNYEIVPSSLSVAGMIPTINYKMQF